jgi:hypothetical protein
MKPAHRVLLGAMVLLAATLWPSALPAAPFATVEAMRGQVTVRDAAGQSRPVAVRRQVHEGDTIETGGDGELHLLTVDDGLLAVRPNSRLQVPQYKTEGADAGIAISLLTGALRSVSGWLAKRELQRYTVTTPTATVGVRGTDHETTVVERDGDDPAGTYDHVFEGRTVLRTASGGEVELAAGEHGHARRDGVLQRLRQAPRFVAARRAQLRLEGRVVQRREALRTRIERRFERQQRIEQRRGERPAGNEPPRSQRLKRDDDDRPRVAATPAQSGDRAGQGAARGVGGPAHPSAQPRGDAAQGERPHRGGERPHAAERRARGQEAGAPPDRDAEPRPRGERRPPG